MIAFSREVGGLTVVGATRWLSPRLALIHLSLAEHSNKLLRNGYAAILLP